MNYKLTIDIRLMHEDPKIPAIDTLKRWMGEGKIELVEAEPPRVAKAAAFNWPGAPAKPAETGFRPGMRPRVKREPGGGANFRGVAAILFPHKDSQKLNMAEINNVAHLVKHHGSKNELFITNNRKDFIDDGKRERLKASFGVIAMTAEEAVAMLSEIEGWK